eukprot:364512-Chlamydomonas_euryale.AAC.1
MLAVGQTVRPGAAGRDAAGVVQGEVVWQRDPEASRPEASQPRCPPGLPHTASNAAASPSQHVARRARRARRVRTCVGGAVDVPAPRAPPG